MLRTIAGGCAQGSGVAATAAELSPLTTPANPNAAHRRIALSIPARQTTTGRPRGQRFWRRRSAALLIARPASTSAEAGSPVVEAAAELMARIRGDFAYDPEAADVSTRPCRRLRPGAASVGTFAPVMIAGEQTLKVEVDVVPD